MKELPPLTDEQKDTGWRIEFCFNCREPYYQLTWFNPSGCPHCHQTFVD